MAIYFKSFNKSISAGSSSTLEWTTTEPITLKRIHVHERTGSSINNVQIYLTIDNEPRTLDYVPAALFTQKSQLQIPFDESLDAKTYIYMKITNNESSSVNLDITFEYSK